jgi:LacI family transcriptional regulator
MQKEITIYDLARVLNLSPATISRGLRKSSVINQKTIQRILDKAEEMGYRHNNFASNLRNKRTKTLGIIVPRLNSYFMTSVVAGMEDVASKEGYNLIISQSLEKKELEKSNANTMFNKRIDGLLISLAYTTTDIAHLQPFFEKQIPVVFFDRSFPGVESVSVTIDNRQAAYKATTHLIEQGCKKIMHLTGNLNRDIYENRLKGYKQALLEHAIPFNEGLVLTSTLNEQDGVNTAKTILAMNPADRPDAVFCANDISAVHCMVHLKQQGISIPEDIAFVGFNNDAVSRMVEPNLTTIDYPGHQIGEVAVSCLLHLLNGDERVKNTDQIIIHSSLLVRGSSLKKKM